MKHPVQTHLKSLRVLRWVRNAIHLYAIVLLSLACYFGASGQYGYSICLSMGLVMFVLCGWYIVGACAWIDKLLKLEASFDHR